MTARIKISQVGRPAGVAGFARTDGLATGALVTLENVGPLGATLFRLLWRPTEDTTAVSSLVATGNPHVWTFSPTASCYGSYLIELVEDGVPIERRVFGIRTPINGLLIPAFNERASRHASLINPGADQKELSENNATDFSDAALNVLNYAGYWRSLLELYRKLESITGGLADHSVPYAKLPSAAAAPSVVGASANGNLVEMGMTTLGAALAAKVPGLLLRAPQILTSGTSINHPTGTRIIKIRGVAGGGAGGGNPATTYTGGANGGSGTYGERTITVASLVSTYTLGAAGVGVSGGNGGDGGNSTFVHNGVTTTLPGGKGGSASSTAVGTAVTVPGGTLGAAATNADLSVRGQPGGAYYRDANNPPLRFHIAPGGSNPLGSGAPAAIKLDNTSLSGNSSSGFGGGGGGALQGNSASAGAGQDGGPPVWIVEEYS